MYLYAWSVTLSLELNQIQLHSDPPPNPILPQPVTQESVPLKKVLPDAARQTGRMKLLNSTAEESLRREMSLSLVEGL